VDAVIAHLAQKFGYYFVKDNGPSGDLLCESETCAVVGRLVENFDLKVIHNMTKAEKEAIDEKDATDVEQEALEVKDATDVEQEALESDQLEKAMDLENHGPPGLRRLSCLRLTQLMNAPAESEPAESELAEAKADDDGGGDGGGDREYTPSGDEEGEEEKTQRKKTKKKKKRKKKLDKDFNNWFQLCNLMYPPMTEDDRTDLASRVCLLQGDSLELLKQPRFEKLLALHGKKVHLFLGDAPYNKKKNPDGSPLETDIFTKSHKENLLATVRRIMHPKGHFMVRVPDADVEFKVPPTSYLLPYPTTGYTSQY